MPDECKVPGDVVASYRKYYIMKKQRFATWKAPAKMPQWFAEGIKNEAQKKSNPIAKEVRTPKYKTRTVKPKKGKGSFSRLKNVMTEDEWVNELKANSRGNDI
jgi:stalled ribosome alternative rescue factor ArfA